MDNERTEDEPSSMAERADANRLRAGDLFFLTLWLQSHVSDLRILAARPELVGPFLREPAVMPRRGSLTNEDVSDLDYVGVVRNALAHSHVGPSRECFLYRPSGGQPQEIDILRTLGLQPSPLEASTSETWPSW